MAVDTLRQLIVVAFRGTELCDQEAPESTAVKNCKANAESLTRRTRVPEWCNGCEVASGDLSAWNDARVGARIIAAVQAANNTYQNFRVLSTGHSFGGAMSTIAAVELRRRGFIVDLVSFPSSYNPSKDILTLIHH